MRRFRAGCAICNANRRQPASGPGRPGLRAVAVTLAAAVCLIGFALALAADNPPAPRTLPARIPEMSAAGKVVEVSETVLKIERTLKGKVELMEFVLEKPFPGLAAGDQIKVNYREKEGRNFLIRAVPAQKTAVRKAVKKELPKEMKQVPTPAGPVVK